MLDQHQRGMQHQLIDHRTTRTLTGGQHHIDEPRRREQHTVTEHRCPPSQPWVAVDNRPLTTIWS